MNKVRLKSWNEARDELQRIAGDSVCADFDRALKAGRKVSAIKLLRQHGVCLESGT